MANKIFGERVRELREQRDLSMQDLANYLEVSKSSINMWENAGVIPREPVLKKISQAFNVSIDYLLGNTTKEQENEKIMQMNKLNQVSQELLASLTEEELDKFISMMEIMFTLDPSKKIDNFKEKFKALHAQVKEAQKYGATIGKVPTEEDNLYMWELSKKYDELVAEMEDENDN